MPWNSEDPSKPGLGDAIKGIGQVAAIAATGGAAAAGEAAGAAAGGEAAAAGNSLGRFGSFLQGKAENSSLIQKMSKSADTEGSFLNKMNQSYGTDKVGNWAPNQDGQGSHIINQQEASGGIVGMGQVMRDTGTGMS